MLVVEDEPLVAMDLVSEMGEVGAEAVTVARSLRDALRAAEEAAVDVAILDGNLDGDPVDGVAAILQGRGIPFCFVLGYGPEHLPEDFRSRPLVQKPFNADLLLGRLVQREAAEA